MASALKRLCYAGSMGWLILASALVSGQSKNSDEVTVYERVDSLDIVDTGKGPRKEIAVKNVVGSSGLKLAFLARATGGITTVALNMFDTKAQDNTTAKAYAPVTDTWLPILYRCDRFRYNGGAPNSTVRADTIYNNVSFHGPATPGQSGRLMIRDLVLYRGEDTESPQVPSGLRAVPGDQGIRLTWQVPKDNVGVALYVISRASTSGKFVKIAETVSPEYVDRPAAHGDYRYRVLAVDFQDNLSPWSAVISASHSGTLAPASATAYESDRPGYAAHVRQIHAAGKGKVVKDRVLQFGDSLSGAFNYQVLTEAALGRYMVEARGRAGWQTSQGRTVIASDLQELKPEFCFILYGTNNAKNRPAVDAAMGDIMAMAKACIEYGAVPLIATIPPRGFTDPASAPEAAFNAALVKTSREAKIPVAYLFEELQMQPERRRFLSGDGVHWDKEGFGIAAQVWKKAMDHVTFVLRDRAD